MNLDRCSGVLLHPTSLPGPYGVGSFDQEAYDWIDFLENSQQTVWQVLPLGPTSFGDSPYQSFSTHAGNPYLIGLRRMRELGLLEEADLAEAHRFPLDEVDFGGLYNWKLPLLKKAAVRFGAHASPELMTEFQAFCQAEAWWLEDFALFMALKDAFDARPWNQWPEELRVRQPEALEKARTAHAGALHAHRFIQWVFDRQWKALRSYANQRGIRIMGDLPIFVAMDSADVWTQTELFYFDRDHQPTVVAGVPPDYFAVTGQLWGNPLYRWQEMRHTGYRWWMDRMRSALARYDLVRIDHFRGFAAYWEVPATEETAIRGRWVKGPGADFFHALQRELGQDLPIVAEDLGDITQDVLDLRDEFGLPGMKVLQFGFGGRADNLFLPHNYTENFVAYSGTHDNDTSRGWYEASSAPKERDQFRRYFGTDGHDAAWTMIRGVFGSVARVAIVPLQDVLNVGAEGRMNMPGRAAGNWLWRYRAEALSRAVSARLADLTGLYGREREKPPVPEPEVDASTQPQDP